MAKKKSKKSRMVAFILSTFFGIIGAHRFYVGRTGSGVAMLLISLTVLGMIVTSVWNLIDWFKILGGSFKDEDGLNVTNWNS
jgi:TM2 domain-containing membrane protein YozV